MTNGLRGLARLALALGASFPCAATLRAQPTLRRLPKAEAEYRDPFTTISGLRELADGRVIVADMRDKSLVLLDLARGTSSPVGRQGAGPAEWGMATVLYPLPGDTTLMLDFTNARLFLIGPDGKPATTVRLAEQSPLFSAQLTGVDAAGRMLLVRSRPPAKPTDPSVGVVDVLRYDRISGRVDTVTTLAEPKGEQTGARMLDGGMMQWVTNLPYAARDLAAIAPDGRVAIVRAAPYRVEWIAPDGRRTVGPVAESPNVRITAAEKDDFTRNSIRPGAILVRGAPLSPTGKGSPARKAPTMPKPDLEKIFTPDQRWPAVKPPFLDAALRIAPDGRAWVLRTRAWDDSIPTYDVFDATGRVVERVALPARTKLVGFGRGTLYLARADEDDLAWLQRVRR